MLLQSIVNTLILRRRKLPYPSEGCKRSPLNQNTFEKKSIMTRLNLYLLNFLIPIVENYDSHTFWMVTKVALLEEIGNNRERKNMELWAKKRKYFFFIISFIIVSGTGIYHLSLFMSFEQFFSLKKLQKLKKKMRLYQWFND